MGKCSAFGCTSRSDRGMQLYSFPKDELRRHLWSAKLCREKFTATKYSKLCVEHFEEDQFLRTPQGRRRMKDDAVPTIFIHCPKPKRRKAPALKKSKEVSRERTDPTYDVEKKERRRKKKEENKGREQKQSQDSDEMERRESGGTEDNQGQESQTEGLESYGTEEKQGEESEGMEGSTSARERHLMVELERSKAMTKKLQLELRRQKRIIASLQKNNLIMETKLGSVFSPDQIRSLSVKNKRNMTWGNDTIRKALQLHSATGTTGYKLLQDMEIPLPDIRTLQRHRAREQMAPTSVKQILEETLAATLVIAKMADDGAQKVEKKKRKKKEIAIDSQCE